MNCNQHNPERCSRYISIEYENPAGVWHTILLRHACEGLKCQQEWVDCPVPELAGAEINININQLENG